MANDNLQNLTPEEWALLEDELRVVAGPPLTEEQLAPRPPPDIPGPPTVQDAARSKQVRVDTARQMLGELDGSETPEFLAKLKLEAGFASENASAPANDASGFTPVSRTPSPDGFALPERGGGVPTMADVERAARGLTAGQPDPEAEFFDIPQDPQFDNPLMDAPPVVGDMPISGGGPMEYLRDFGREAGEQFSQFGTDVDRGLTSLFPNLTEEMAVTNDAVPAAFEGYADADAAGRGQMIGEGFIETTSGAGRELMALGNDTFGRLNPLVEGAAGIYTGIFGGGGGNQANAADEITTNIPPTPVAEEDPPGNEDVDDQGNLSRADASQKAAEDNVGKGGGKGEEPTSFSYISDENGVQSGPTTFEETPTGIHINNPELEGPPLGGMEIIRGLNRSFQPFNEQGRVDPDSGEIPFGDDAFERMRNSGLSADQAIDLTGEQATAQLAANNAVTQINLPQDDGTTLMGLRIVDPEADGGIRIVPTDVLVPLTETMAIASESYASPDGLGGLIELDRPVFLRDSPDGSGITRIQVTPGNAGASALLLNEKNHGPFADFMEQVAAGGITDPEAQFNEALLLLQEFVDNAER